MINAVVEYGQRGCLVWAQDFPGAYARAQTIDQALLKLPDDVHTYCVWAGILNPDGAAVVKQQSTSNLAVEDADTDVLFDSERLPLDNREYEWLRMLALRSARNVQTLYNAIPDPDRSTKPERETFWGMCPRTARKMYGHMNTMTQFYAGQLGADVALRDDIPATREAAIAALETLPSSAVDAIATDHSGEQWNLHKILRRFIWHDRIHARAMYRLAVDVWGVGAVANPFVF